MRRSGIAFFVVSGLASLLAVVMLTQPAAQVSNNVETSENQELYAEELADQLSRATPHQGAISNIRVQITQCILEVEVEFDRPCTSSTKGEFLLSMMDTVYLNELNSSVESINFSSQPGDEVDIVHWSFSEEISGRMRSINEVLRAETARYQATGVDGGERAERLTELSRRLLGEYGVNSRVSLDYCLQETAVYPFSFDSVAFSLSSDKSRELVGRLASYAEARCAR